jgi:DNA polymerase V
MYALADCNNFYCSCERLFQPKLNYLPVIVLSNNDGCAIARSEEAKAIGIKMGDPAFLIRDLIEKHNVQVFSSNYALYGDISRRVVEVYRQFAKELEVYSIDESFLYLFDYAGVDLESYASRIRNTVKQWIGIPICIGLGESKTLAKAANRYAKKMHREKGVFIIDTEDKRKEVLEYLAVEDVWGIGRKYALWLQSNKIANAWQLSNCNEDWIRSKMGVVGVRLVKELNGVSCLELEEVAPTKKVICTSRSFGTLLSSKSEIAKAVATHATRCGEKLRSDGICASAINVFIHTNPHRKQDRQYHGSVTIPLHRPTNYTGDLIHFALRGLQAIFKPNIKYLKAGVMCLDMTPQDSVQQTLYEEQADQTKAKQAIKAIDKINALLGRDKVRFAAAGYSKDWKLKNNHQSPCYTTNLYDLPHVNLHHVPECEDTQ